MSFDTLLCADDDPEGNVQHLADHGLSKEDVELVLRNPNANAISRSSGLPAVFGYTPSDEHVIVVFESIDPHTIRVVTAYEIPE